MKFATIFKSDLEYISKCILDYPDIETGGDFFGFWNNLGLPVIQYITGPGENSYHNIAFFKQDIDFLQKAGDAAYKCFGMQHIGSWHSHHKLGLAQPSGHDCQTMANAIRNNNLNQFFMILGNIREDSTTINGFLFDKENGSSYYETKWRIINRENPFNDSINNHLNRKFKFFSSDVYVTKTKRARLVNLKTVNPINEELYTLDFKPEKWLGSKKGRDELKYVFDWLLKKAPESKMFVNDSNDLTIESNSFKIIFSNNFPNVYPTIISENTIEKNGNYFLYSSAKDITNYLDGILKIKSREYYKVDEFHNVKKEDGTSLDTNETQHESILTKETNIKIDSEQNLNNEFKPE